MKHKLKFIVLLFWYNKLLKEDYLPLLSQPIMNITAYESPRSTIPLLLAAKIQKYFAY